MSRGKGLAIGQVVEPLAQQWLTQMGSSYQINPQSSTPAADIFAMLPKKTTTAIQRSPQMKLMGHQAGRLAIGAISGRKGLIAWPQGLARASYSQVNEYLMDQNFIDQPVTTARGAKNPYNNTDVKWLEADYGTRNKTIAGLDEKESKYLRGFEGAWLEETPVTTASAPNNDGLTIGS